MKWLVNLFMNVCIGKTSWPELLMKKGEDAVAVIESENKFVTAIVLKDGSPTTSDYRCDRVFVWVNDCGNIIHVPIVG